VGEGASKIYSSVPRLGVPGFRQTQSVYAAFPRGAWEREDFLSPLSLWERGRG